MNDLFDFKPRRRMFGLLGNPVSHSKSPLIHGLFGKQTNLEIEYKLVQVDLGGFTAAVRNFHANGGTGINVTVPFKVEAFELADHLTRRGQTAGAVNTFKFSGDGEISADNTDGIGMVVDIQNNIGCQLAGARVLILGAGGAVRGVLQPVLEQLPKEVVVANRTVDKAMALARSFADEGPISACSLAGVSGRFDVIINGTSASLAGEVPPIDDSAVAGCKLAYDMMYADKPTVFMDWARQHGAEQCRDGLGMLVEQAAEAFALWNDVRPETDAVIRHLRPG
jgi:shikimate dehydrogenase